MLLSLDLTKVEQVLCSTILFLVYTLVAFSGIPFGVHSLYQ